MRGMMPYVYHIWRSIQNADSPFGSPPCAQFLLSNYSGVWIIWRGYWYIKCVKQLPSSQIKTACPGKQTQERPKGQRPRSYASISVQNKNKYNLKAYHHTLIHNLSREDYNNIVEMSSEYTQSLIEYESQRLDLELQYECFFLKPLMSSKPLPPIGEYVFQQNPQVQDYSIKTDEDSMDISTSQGEASQESSGTQSHKNGSLRKTKKISKKYSLSDTSDSESQTQTKKKKAGKAKTAKNPQYPTKNFLPNFKTPHLDFLRQFLKVDIMQNEFIRYLDQKDGISLKDYEHLYNMPEFTQAFEAMFECRYLYRELMLSRSGLKAKRVHQRKLYVFEDAFRNKIFPRINY